MVTKLLFTLSVITVAIRIAVACNGYKARLTKLENCAGPNAIIAIDPDFTVKLSKNCELVPEGCVNNKGFKTAIAKYRLQKNGLVLKQGTLDLCAAAGGAPSEVKDVLTMFGAPTKCPALEDRICANNNKVDLSKYKAMLSLARGNIILDAEVEHDAGKSCFHVEILITRT